ncbi:filamentous haemagglutinin family outer membrane protein [Histophilus somni 2336]|uniref:two-partner secretion domain-containing protein n=2 Tax=Histophilus somni TaxID=731 RepID=UPI0000397627|nr:hemagglutinin repeat-containing protein [Histophilus somni]ACA31896.1 filamentous haemagglutinin family outer membrane protein [Histophilus somni 2336]
MNKRQFRVIFSKTLQPIVVVSEPVKTEGKTKSEMPQMQSAVNFLPIFAALTPLVFRLFCALSFVFSSSVFAETLIIKADPNAPKNQQPIVLQTANGLPQVNIQTPNDKGLSHNKYQDFNVDKKGAILNNSHKDTQTQQAGWVQSNPYLARGEAKVILNEVTSTHPTQLKGYVEVAGRKAEVIIANPNGLHCDGCGTINATRSTMTTGKPQIIDGQVESINIERGKITISGKGLDNSRVNYTDILAREAEINAGVWAGKKLNVVTGKNTIKQADMEHGGNDLQITHIDSQNLSENAPHFALDVSELGGMYAGKIHLVGTEQGLGVRNAGHIGASADNLVIDSQGKIVNQGMISAKGNLHVSTKKEIQNQGQLLTEAQLSTKSSHLDNRGGKIEGRTAQINATETVNNDRIGSTGSLIQTAEKLDIHSKLVTNKNTKASQSKPPEQGIIAGVLTINGDALANQNGAIYGMQNVQLNLSVHLDNQQGEILSLGELQIQGDKLNMNNEHGEIASRSNLAIYANKLESEGEIESSHNASIHLKQDLTLNNAFKVGGNLDFQTQGNFINNSVLRVGEKLSIQAHNINNNRESELSGKNTQILSNEIINRGLIDGEKTLLKSTALSNLGTGRIYGNHLAIATPNLINGKEDNASPTIAARERLDLAVGSLINRDHALIFSAGEMGIGGHLNEQHHAEGKASFIDNGSATIEALGNAYVNTARLQNHDLHLRLGENHTDERRVEYAPKNTSRRYVLIDKDGNHGRFDSRNNSRSDRNSYLRLNDGTTIAANSWMHWDYNRHTITTTIEKRDPAKILIGGDLHLSGNDLENNASTLSVGKRLLLGDEVFIKNDKNETLHSTTGTSLNNIDIAGTINVTDKGHWDSFHKKKRRYGIRGRKRWAVYGTGRGDLNDIHPTSHFFFNKVDNTIGQPVDSTNTQITAQAEAIVPNQMNGVIINLPEQSLYQINPDAPNGYLVETDPHFTNRKQWLSSDYMLNALRYNHENVQKRLGDGFYEQRLINEQIHQLTGRRFLDNHQTDDEQYKALMDSGIYYAKKFNLHLGVGLTAEQMAELTADMVWFVNKEITLPSGKKLTVLTPQVYLVARNLDVTSQGALISAREIMGNINGKLTNTGTIAGRNLTALSAKNINNQGLVLGDSVNLLAKQKLVNLGGRIEALDSVTLVGKEGVDIASTTTRLAYQDDFGNKFDRTHVDNLAGIHVKDKNGKLIVHSPKDVTIKGAELNSAGGILVQANHIDIGTLNTKNKTDYNADMDNYYRLEQHQEVGSQLNGKGNITLAGEQGVVIRQGEIHSENGDVHIASNGNIRIEEGRNKERLSSASKVKHSGFLQSTTDITKHDHHYDLAQGSTLDGKNVVLQSNANLTVQGSNIVAENQLNARAKNIAIKEAENRVFEQDVEKTTKSGLMSSGGFGFSIGEKKTTTETNQTKYYATGSQVGSLKGDTALIAGKHYQQTGSTLSSLEGDVTIGAKKVDILAADDRYESRYKQTMEQKGFTIAVNIPVVQAVQNALAVAKQAEQVGESKHSRINAMAAANTAWSAYRAGQGLMQASQSLSQMANGNMAQGANVSVSITYGEQKNVQTTDIQGNTAANSAINAGGKVTVTATGAGKESDIHVVGSDVSGQQGTLLQAEDEINVLAAKQTHQERSQNKSAGFNAGVAVSYGSNGLAFGFTVGGNYGKGYGNGDETTYRHSHIGDKHSQTHIMSGGDTTLRGAQVRGKGVQVHAQNLSIESLQDTMTYKGKQMNVSGQVTVGYGFSASANFNQSKINADYASVQEQSGIYAGDEGYQINIAQHTDLKGGLITSTAQAENQGKNQFSTGTLSYSDIQNHADYNGSAVGVGVQADINGGWDGRQVRDGSPVSRVNQGIGFGYDKDSQSSLTKSGINTQNLIIRDEQGQLAKTGKTIETTRGEISTNITTDSAEQHTGKLAPNFDKERLQKELDLQREVTQKFDQTRQEVKAELYDIVDEKREKATQIRKINGGYDTELSAQLDREATDLDEKVRWLDMGLGLLQGSAGNSKTMLGVFAGTQADRAVRSATAPKEMWYHKKVINEKTGKVKLESRQIWSLNDLSREELASIQDTNGKVITVSNPGIFNNREDSLSNAEKQNLNSTNSSGVIVVMNPPTGNYKGWWILSSMVSELMYVGYDQLNNKVFQGYLPKTNSEKLNQDIYREVQNMGNGWSVDTDNHSRGGITASVALKDWVNNKEQNGIAPIRKARFYGTATNVQNDYADVLQKNGYTYTSADGKTYNSGAYSIVHDKDFVGNKWIPFLLGNNETTKGDCGIFCYSHSSYFAEVPEQYQRDEDGNIKMENGKPVETENWKDYTKKWGTPKTGADGDINHAIPKLVNPNNPNGEKYETNPF